MDNILIQARKQKLKDMDDIELYTFWREAEILRLEIWREMLTRVEPKEKQGSTQTWRESKRELILAALEKYDGNRTLAAHDLGMTARNIRWHLKRMNDGSSNVLKMREVSTANAKTTAHAGTTGKAR